MSGGTKPTGSLGFIAPLIVRPPIQEPEERKEPQPDHLPPPPQPSVDPSLINPPHSLPRVLLGGRPSPSNPLSSAPSREFGALSENEKKSFFDAVHSLITDKISEKSETFHHINRIVKLATHYELDRTSSTLDEILNAVDKMAKSAVKDEIESAILTRYPQAYLALKGSEFIDIFRPALQAAILTKVQEIGERPRGRMLTSIPSLDDLRSSALLTGWAALEVGSWPHRLVDLYSNEAVDLPKGIAVFMGQGVLDDAKLYRDVLRGLFSGVHLPKPPDISPLSLEGRYHFLKTPKPSSMESPVDCPVPLRSQTGQEDGGDYELLDFVTPEAEAHADFVSHMSRSPAQPAEKEEKEPRPSRSSDKFSVPIWRPEPSPLDKIREVVGGSFAVSGGSGQKPQFKGQVDVTISGPKQLHIPDYVARQSGADNGIVGGPYRFGQRETPYISIPVQRALEKFNQRYGDYQAKEAELFKALSPAPSADGVPESHDSIFHRMSDVFRLAEEQKQKIPGVLEAAWAVRKLVRTEAQRELLKEYRPRYEAINEDIKNVLRNEFKVPQHSRLEKKHLNEAGKYKDLDSIKTYATQTQSEAQAAQSAAQLDQAIPQTFQLLSKLEADVIAIESSDGPVDEEKLFDVLDAMRRASAIYAAQTRARGAESPQAIESKIASIEGRIEELALRDARFIKIISGHMQLLELYDLALSQLSEHKDEKKFQDTLSGIEILSSAINRQSLDLGGLITDDDLPRSKELSQIGEKIAAKANILSAAERDIEIAKAGQAYNEMVKAILEMENSDEPVDLHLFNDRRQKLNQLAFDLTGLLHTRLSLNELSEADYNRTWRQIQDQSLAIDHRDARVMKIQADYAQFNEMAQLLLSQLITPKDPQEVSEQMAKVETQRLAIERMIAEIVAYSPSLTERNQQLIAIQDDVGSRCDVLGFCTRSTDEKLAALDALQVRVRAVPEGSSDRAKAMDDYQKRAALFSMQLFTGEDYETFSQNFLNFTRLLSQEKSLSDRSIDLLVAMGNDFMQGIIKGKVSPEPVIPLLEAVEQNHSKNKEVEKIHVVLGSLYVQSDQRNSLQAMRWYRLCMKKEPGNALWPRVIALGHLDALRYSNAEKSILEALEINPEDEKNRKDANDIVKDKYQFYSLLLEWFQTGISYATPDLKISPTQEEELVIEKLLRTVTAGLKAVHGALNVATHPGVLKMWLPRLLSLDDQLEKRLDTLLAEDTATHFTPFNIVTLGTRAVSAVTGVVGSYFSPVTHPTFHQYVRGVDFSTRAVQQLTGLYSTYSSLSDLLSKFRSAQLTLPRFIGSSALSVLTPINLLIPRVQSFLYRDERERLALQRAQPVLHAAINTLGSQDLGSVLPLFGLAMQSSGFIARVANNLAQRITLSVPSTETLAKAITVACVGFLAYKATQIFFREKALLDGSAQQGLIVPRAPQSGIMAYLRSWWEYFTSSGQLKHGT